jgi:histidinol dehydrogenase
MSDVTPLAAPAFNGLPRLSPSDLRARARGRQAVSPEALATAAGLLEEVRLGGEPALRGIAERFGDLEPGAPLVFARPELEAALAGLPPEQRALLERVAARIRAFATAQRQALAEVRVPVPGGWAGHRVLPLQRAGCYAPGGRFPLPSSVLMTVITARVAGVEEVWVASPRPTAVTLAAAALAGADALLAVGGAQAIAALAEGVGPVPPCDVIVGPGNAWVTAAKQLVSGKVRIDMLAGPSELVVLADGDAAPDLVAADLIAQAEHDPEAWPVLVTTSGDLIPRVDAALAAQLTELATAEIAQVSLASGAAILCPDLVAAIEVCDELAPEHLELQVADPAGLAPRLRSYGALFVGAGAAEVLGDYGAGPNHVLPTGGSARAQSGLSVLTFLRVATYLEIEDEAAARGLAEDARDLALLEGLAGHAQAAELRLAD